MSYKIYLIKHLDTDMKYVGITGADLGIRWEQHFHSTNAPLRTALRTEGHRMVMELLEEVDTKEEAHKREQQLIHSLGTATPNGWNRQVTNLNKPSKKVQHSNVVSLDKMFKNGKRQSLFTRKKHWSQWEFDSTVIYDNCKIIDFTDFSYYSYPSYGRLIFTDDIGTENGIWCIAPRPHILDHHFECAASDKYFLVSFNDMFNPFGTLRPHPGNPITYTLHSCLWYDDLKNPNAKWHYEGTYLTKLYMNDFNHERNLEELLMRHIQMHKVVDEITFTNWGKVGKVDWDPITEYNECDMLTKATTPKAKKS